ncbi:type VII secretion integral membrane protein EccD [Nocardia flavorosea]|uniref:type VII secretion integral membrane protein EccD n=1 Tax=Nocardia flavorosea TaxID=53429 RepID=UPI0018959F7F|nr:type VII secretion integral membrane protein EccD [Nocardia flavorosea]MBF6351421.1 type VII secretion integral membrane protein EccD [Nocardia flavorosea]
MNNVQEAAGPPDLEPVALSEPELRRVSVIGGNTQVDLGLPATVPLVAFIGELVAVLESRNAPPAEPDENAPQAAEHWTLGRLGQPPISLDATLAEAEVFDGDLLMLRAVRSKEPPPLFDDVIDAVARLTESAFRNWNDTAARWLGLAVALLSTAMAMVLFATCAARIASGATAIATGVAAFVTAVIVARRHTVPGVAAALLLCALVLFGPGVALLVPGEVGGPHALLVCASSVVVAVVMYRLTGAAATIVAAALTLAVFGGVAAAVLVFAHVDPVKIAAGGVAAALTFVTPTAQLSRLAAKLPVPPVPTAGGVIDPADHEPRPTIEGIGAIGATALPSASGLSEKARAANRFQSGMIIGATVATGVSAFVAADPFGSREWQGVALAAIVGVVLILRGRAYADLIQAGVLIGGGSATLIALMFGLGIGAGDVVLPLAGALLALAAGALFLGVVGPSTDPSPLVRRAGELFEYGLIVAMLPLVVWIMDLYALARSI